MSSFQKKMDEINIKHQSQFFVGARVREADGWEGVVVKVHAPTKRNQMGHVGCLAVQVINHPCRPSGQVLECVPASNYTLVQEA